jgi:hypothetical protein
VRGEKDRPPSLSVLPEQLHEPLLHEWIEALGGFVQDDDGGFVLERLNDPDLLFHSP